MRNKIYPVLLVIFTMLITSIATSQAKTSETTYYACVNKSSGSIKMVSSNKKCAKKENKISWNNIGPAGADGSDATTSYSTVVLTPGDFVAAESFNSAHFDIAIVPSGIGWSRPSWILEGDTNDYATLWTNVSPPSDWESATHVKITYNLYAADVTNNTTLYIGYEDFTNGQTISIWGNYGPTFDATPANETMFEISETRAIGENTDLMDIAIWRSTDQNTGDIYVLGAKVEALVIE